MSDTARPFEFIHNAGREAFWYGRRRETNPYATSTDHRAAWFAGYDEAQRESAMRATRYALAELVTASNRTSAAITAWRTSGKPNHAELHAAQSDLIVALARIGGAK